MISRIVGDALFGGRHAGFFDDDDDAVRRKRSPSENAFGLEGDGENVGGAAADADGSSDFDRRAARSCCDWMSRSESATLLVGTADGDLPVSNSPERNMLNDPVTREDDDGGVRGAAFATTCDASGGLPTSTFSSSCALFVTLARGASVAARMISSSDSRPTLRVVMASSVHPPTTSPERKTRVMSSKVSSSSESNLDLGVSNNTTSMFFTAYSMANRFNATALI
jgi:hypothetical protein